MHPPRFDCLQHHTQPFAEGAPELDWLELALAGTPVAAVWQAGPALVAPASYRHLLGPADADRGSADPAWPVRLRRSGGGVVPQGPGIANLSLAYLPGGGVGDCGEQVYRHLCDLLSLALAALGVATFTSSIPGSFCDGRFNLAAGTPAAPRKLAGTAQYWRTRHGRQAVLAHAVVLLEGDPVAFTAQVNALETRLGTGRRFDARTLSTAHAEGARLPDGPPGGTPATLVGALADALATGLQAPLQRI